MTDYPASLPRARRRAAGAFYTPPDLVAEVVAETLGRLGPRNGLRVLDPAAGDGRFLAACADYLAARGWVGQLTGVERDPAAAAAARARLGPAADIRVGEALLGGVVEPGAWDAVVGNPPWVRSLRLKAADPALWTRLRGAFAATSYREWDLYAAFIERALDWVAPDGEIGLVVPSRWLTAAFAAPLREKISPAVRRVVDFGARQVFAGATTYAAVLYMSPAFRGAAAAGDGAPLSTGRAPWIKTTARLDELRRSGPPLGDVARIAKGAGSNADPVFLLEPRGDVLWSAALGEPVSIEPEALVPCLRGRDVGAGVRRLALLPYDGNRLIPDLAARWPLAAAYLERCRPLLERRENGRFTGETFHAWGRPQNLVWLRDPAPKIVVPDAANAPRAALDERGTLVIDTAYAIRPTGAVPIERILAVLQSPLVAEWLRATGIPLRGDYFRMKTAYLASLPVPDENTLRSLT